MSAGYVLSGIENEECTLRIYDTARIGMSLFSFWVFIFLLVPATIMFVGYIKMVLVVTRNVSGQESGDKNVSLNASAQRAKTVKRVQMNVIQTCVIVCLFFVCTMLFCFATDALIIFNFVDDFSATVWNLSFISLVSNSCVNPFVYTLRYIYEFTLYVTLYHSLRSLFYSETYFSALQITKHCEIVVQSLLTRCLQQSRE